VSFRVLTFTVLASLLAIAPKAGADDLPGALVSVYESNPRLLAERARLREVDESYVQARAQGRPTIGGTGTISQSFVNFPGGAAIFSGVASDIGGDVSISGRPNDIGVQVVQPLYQGGRVKALKSQAKLSILAARETLRAQENNLFLEAANAYVDVRRDTEAMRIRRNNVRVLMRQLEAASARFEVGSGTRTDIAQSEARLAVAEAGLAQADAQLAVSEANYIRHVGQKPVQLSAPPIYALPVSLPERLTSPKRRAAQQSRLPAGCHVSAISCRNCNPSMEPRLRHKLPFQFIPAAQIRRGGDRLSMRKHVSPLRPAMRNWQSIRPFPSFGRSSLRRGPV